MRMRSRGRQPMSRAPVQVVLYFARSEKGDGTTSRSKVRIDLGESEEYTYDDQNENPGKSTARLSPAST